MRRLCRAAVFAIALVGLTRASRATVIDYQAVLSGPNESPPNASPATGFAEVTINTLTSSMRVQVSFSGLTTGSTASHIHSATASPHTGTAMVATTTPTFPNFPLGVTSGTYDQTFDLTLSSSYNPAFVTANGGTVAAAEAALLAGLAAGEAYLNIHSTMFPGGEIRGFLDPAVPEPGSVVLLTLGAIGTVAYRLRRLIPANDQDGLTG
jgi:hypothetical protein